MKMKTMKNNENHPESTNSGISGNPSKRKRKWWKIILWLLIIGFSLLFLPLIWIPALVAIIVFAVKKGPHKKRNILLSLIVALSSFVIMMSSDYSPPELTGIKVEWNSNEYDISDSTEVTITPVPSTAKIESLTLSENSIATLEYDNGKALITFKAEGSEKLHFIANKKLHSKAQLIKVVDKKAEEERVAAEKKAEKERIAAEKKAEEERAAAEKKAEEERAAAEKKAEEERAAAEKAEAERIAQEQAAQTQNSNNNFNTYDNPSQQQTTSSYVLNTSTMKFHSPSCRDVKKIAPQNYSTYDGTRDGIISQGYSPCGHCKP